MIALKMVLFQGATGKGEEWGYIEIVLQFLLYFRLLLWLLVSR